MSGYYNRYHLIFFRSFELFSLQKSDFTSTLCTYYVYIFVILYKIIIYNKQTANNEPVENLERELQGYP